MLYGRSNTSSSSRILVAKELVKMMIRNNEELKLFEETLDRCSESILVVTPRGEQYDLNDPAQRYLGIAEMLRRDVFEEPELFASCPADEMKFFDYLKAVEKQSA